MAILERIEADDRIPLGERKYILNSYVVHTGEFETKKYFEEADIGCEASKPKSVDLSPIISLERLLNAGPPPDVSTKEKEDEQETAEDKI